MYPRAKRGWFNGRKYELCDKRGVSGYCVKRYFLAGRGLVLWYRHRNDFILVVFAAVYGLSLCNHNTMHFLGPLFAVFVLAVDRAPFQRWKVYLGLSVLALGVAGLVHLYLPIRSMADPQYWVAQKTPVLSPGRLFGLSLEKARDCSPGRRSCNPIMSRLPNRVSTCYAEPETSAKRLRRSRI